MTLYSLTAKTPRVDDTAWIAPDANIIGNVILRENTSVWFCVSLRGVYGEEGSGWSMGWEGA